MLGFVACHHQLDPSGTKAGSKLIAKQPWDFMCATLPPIILLFKRRDERIQTLIGVSHLLTEMFVLEF